MRRPSGCRGVWGHLLLQRQGSWRIIQHKVVRSAAPPRGHWCGGGWSLVEREGVCSTASLCRCVSSAQRRHAGARRRRLQRHTGALPGADLVRDCGLRGLGGSPGVIPAEGVAALAACPGPPAKHRLNSKIGSEPALEHRKENAGGSRSPRGFKEAMHGRPAGRTTCSAHRSLHIQRCSPRHGLHQRALASLSSGTGATAAPAFSFCSPTAVACRQPQRPPRHRPAVCAVRKLDHGGGSGCGAGHTAAQRPAPADLRGAELRVGQAARRLGGERGMRSEARPGPQVVGSPAAAARRQPACSRRPPLQVAQLVAATGRHVDPSKPYAELW